MTLALRRVTFLTIVSAVVFGLSWVVLLVISQFVLKSTKPIEIGALLQASAGTFCFAYSLVHFRSTATPPLLAQCCEALGIAAFGISLWIFALPHLSNAYIPLGTFAFPAQIGWIIGGDGLITARLLRRYRAIGRQIWVILLGNIGIGILCIYCLKEFWGV